MDGVNLWHMFLLSHYSAEVSSAFAFQVRFFEAPLRYGEYQTLSSQGQIELVFSLAAVKALQLALVLQMVAAYILHTSSGFVVFHRLNSVC